MTRPSPALLQLARTGRLGEFTNSDELLASAIEHRMEGLLWSALRDDPDTGGEVWRRDVARNDLLNQRRNKSNWHGLRSAVDLASSIGVKLGTMKGVTAEARWYDRLGDRPSGDLDLVIAPSDLELAPQLIELLGPDQALGFDVQPYVMSGVLQSVELRSPRGVAIDLHFDLLKIGMPSREPLLLWEHMVPYESEFGTEVLVPGAELALLQLVLHLTKDRFRTLLGFVDAQRLIAHEDIDWKLFHALARSQGLENAVNSALNAVSDVVPIDVEPTPTEPGGSGFVWRLLWRPSIRLRGHGAVHRFRHRQELLPFLARGRKREAFRYWIRRRAWPPVDLLRLRDDAAGGPYWWRITGGRFGSALRRRRGAGRHP